MTPEGQTKRPSRQAEVGAERRRRRDGSNDMGVQFALQCDPRDLDPNYIYRWINDVPGRLCNLTERDDYDFVPADAMKGVFDTQNDRAETSERISRVVDRTTGQKAYLCRKPKDFWTEDYERGISAQNAALADRLVNVPDDLADGEVGYVPQGNKVTRRRSYEGV